ncbi:MAG: hypothetical protein JWQ83_727 [Lacunisphaera sp.]|jgi:predicted secreted acid phosphatase|nr:hypothetical protein [Lacunisphaera sp.]MDB6165587.1 hypothetical protein [Lacunisphaera sp.]
MFHRIPRAVLAAALALTFVAGPVLALEPANIFPHKVELRTYVDTGGYAKDVAAVALEANKWLQKRIPRGTKHGRLAVVFDIDETTLSNLSHIIAMDYGYVPKLWDEWLASGRCPAIIPVQTVYDTAVRGKIDVIFITGRRESDRAATERNLRQVGYETWTRIYYKPQSETPVTMAGFKTDVRRKLMQEGYVIIANIGDQNSDLANGYAEKWFKLPNPFYISK